MDIGSKLGHYEILDRLGAGAMGEVYRARDTRLKRDVAIKVIAGLHPHDARARKLFLREAQAMATVSHPNVVHVYDFDEADSLLYIVMEFIDGESLAQNIKDRGGLPVGESLRILQQTLQALDAAWANGIVHRDIKPSNVLIDRTGLVRVCDFGLAKPVPLDPASGTTHSGLIVGTPRYMSPEQASGQPIDFRSDIYSLGVVFYEVLVGCPPFQGHNQMDLMAKHLRDPLPSLDRSELGVSEAVVEIYGWMTEKDAAERPESYAILLEHVETAMEGTSVRPPRLRQLLSRTRHRVAADPVTSILTALMVALVSLIVWGVMTSSSDPPPGQSRASPIAGELTVAIMDFRNNTGNPALDWLSRDIPMMLATNLGRSRYLKLLESREPPGSANGGRPSIDAASSADPVGDADVIMSGSFFRRGEELRILMQLSDPKTGALLRAEPVDVADTDSLPGLLDQLAGKVRVALEIEAIDSYRGEEGVILAQTEFLEAWIHYEAGRESAGDSHYEDAISSLRKATAIDPCFARAYDRVANVYLILGEDALATAAMDKALECADRLTELEELVILRRQAQLGGEVGAERDYLERLVSLKPDEPDWRFNLGWHLFTHSRSCERGIRQYRESANLAPDHQPRLYAYLGYTYLACGERTAGLEAYRQYVDRRPDEAEAHSSLADAYLATGEYKAAERSWRSALRIDPEYGDAHRGLGDYHLLTGRREHAVLHYERAVAHAIGPDQEEVARLALAGACRQAGQVDRAVQIVTEVVGPDFRRLSGQWQRGLAELASGDVDAAAATAVRMSELLDSTESRHEAEYSHHLRAMVLLARGDLAGAIDELEAAVELPSLEHRSVFRQALGDAYAESGDLERAQRVYTEIFQLDPNYARAHLMLGRIHEQQGRLREALRSYRQFIQTWSDADGSIATLVSEVEATVHRLQSLIR